MQKKYSLSDSDMLGITEAIDNSQNATEVIHNGIIGTWKALLAQEGKTWEEFSSDNPLPVTQFAIPRDQSGEIMERMKKRLFALNISPIGITNVLMDWVNVGPSSYEN